MEISFLFMDLSKYIGNEDAVQNSFRTYSHQPALAHACSLMNAGKGLRNCDSSCLHMMFNLLFLKMHLTE